LWFDKFWGRSYDAFLLAVLEGVTIDSGSNRMPKAVQSAKLVDGKMELRNEPREECGKKK